MANKILIFGIFAVVVIAVGIGLFFMNQQKDTTTPPTNNNPNPTNPSNELIIVKQSGGEAMLDIQCANKSYISETADYIVEGTVRKAEAKWNEQQSFITTFVDFSIENYVKGTSIGDTLQMQVGGGCVDGICQSSSEDATFKQDDHLRLYFHKTETEFWIVCAHQGVQSI